jgi:tetratricopeptide (TPR) repeat protein
MDSIFDLLGRKDIFDLNPRELILPRMLSFALKNKNKSKLEEILKENFRDLSQNQDTLNLSIKASLFVGDLNLAYNLAKDLPFSVARAMIEYENKKYGEASCSFDNTNGVQPNMRILYSLSHYYFAEEKSEVQNIEKHRKILKSITETSDRANLIIGAVYFNRKEFEKAKHYFRKAKEINGSEKNYLNFFRAQYITNERDQVYLQMNDFFINTNSKLNSEQIDEELKKIKINPLLVKISNLYEIISKLL